MKLALFLHFYQPPTQTPDILYKICQESYEPVVSILEANPGSRITFNISGSLIEQLTVSHGDILQKIKKLASRGQVELTGSAIYHPLLTEIPPAEVSRQIELNSQILKNQLGNGALRGGFFPPEMSVDKNICQLVKDFGFKYLLADSSITHQRQGKDLDQSNIFIDNQSGIKIVCRNNKLSLDIAFSRINSIEDFLLSAKDLPYVVLAMDGETFGHHRPEQMGLFASLMELNSVSKEVQLVDLAKLISSEVPSEITVEKSSWARSFDRWRNPSNNLHQAQWQLLNLAVKTVEEFPETGPGYWQARSLLDKGLHSDQFWWSSHNPCWHYKMVERGARLLLESIQALPGQPTLKNRAQNLYDNITQTGLKMYGDTVIGC